MGKANFSEQFRKRINRYKRIGYNPYVMRQTACLFINPTSVDSYASLVYLYNGGLGPQTHDGLDIKLSKVGLGLMLCLWFN